MTSRAHLFLGNVLKLASTPDLSCDCALNVFFDVTNGRKVELKKRSRKRVQCQGRRILSWGVLNDQAGANAPTPWGVLPGATSRPWTPRVGYPPVGYCWCLLVDFHDFPLFFKLKYIYICLCFFNILKHYEKYTKRYQQYPTGGYPTRGVWGRLAPGSTTICPCPVVANYDYK